MDIEKIKTFYLVCKHGSVKNAAKDAFLTVSGINRQIASLEKELGHKLYDTIKQRIVLTSKGKVFYDSIKPLLTDYKLVQERLASEDEIAGKISISSTNAIVNMSLIEFMPKLMDLYPALNIELISRQSMPDFLTGETDIAIMPKPASTEYLNCTYIKTFKNKLHASLDYIEKFGEPKTIEDLKHHRLIDYTAFTPNTNINIAELDKLNFHLNLQNQTLQPKLTVNSGYASKIAIDKGLGIGIMSDTFSNASHLKTILPDLEGPEIHIYLTTLQTISELPKIKAVSEFLIKEMRNQFVRQ